MASTTTPDPAHSEIYGVVTLSTCPGARIEGGTRCSPPAPLTTGVIEVDRPDKSPLATAATDGAGHYAVPVVDGDYLVRERTRDPRMYRPVSVHGATRVDIAITEDEM